MRPRILLLSAALLAALPVSAGAAVQPGSADDHATQPRVRADGGTIRLAQNRPVDVFYDAMGRRVLLDRFTGEVVAIEPPRQQRGLGQSGVLTARPGAGDPAELDRRYREYQLGLREPPEDGELAERDYGAFPEAPAEAGQQPWPGSGWGTETVRREPLPDNPLTGSTPPPEPRAPQAVQPAPSLSTTKIPQEEVAKLQVLLDRAGISPGVIDGRMGSNVQKSLDALAEMTGERLDPKDKALIDRMLEDTGGPAFTTYEIGAADAAGPFVASVPEDYSHKAQLDHLSFTSVTEMLAERFHMDEAYLKSINPGADFNRPGTLIKVAAPGAPKTGAVARIVADKGRTQVRAYDAMGNLIAAYPATIGSTDTPSPSGTVQVDRIAFDPEYTYNPKINFTQGNNTKVLRIPPGPNGPVGSIWIALSKPTYGIHGTPEPSRIGKTNSHGCVRLTNWDAHELAKMVKPGVTVEFLE